MAAFRDMRTESMARHASKGSALSPCSTMPLEGEGIKAAQESGVMTAASE